jgi:hypothetical protein
LLYFAQALAGSFRWAECLGTLALRADDRVLDVARGIPAFDSWPEPTADRARVFLFGLLCGHHDQLLPMLRLSGVRRFAKWLCTGASPPVLASMKSEAIAAGADPQIVARLGTAA